MGELDRQPMVGLGWLLRLRWLVAVGHLLLVVCNAALGAEIHWWTVAGVLAIGVISNGVLSWRADADRPAQDRATAAIMALDVGLLTALLAATGGASNPFTFLYLFQLVLAAMVLEPRWLWPLVVLDAAGYAALFRLTPPDPHAGHGGHDMRNHFVGMWIAFAVSGPFAALAVTRVRTALAEARARVEEARQLEERAQRLTALGTLAAGAAHELATPLSTIAVVAGDLRRSQDPEVASDAALIGAQVQRCRAVLAQLAADGGHGMGQPPVDIRGAELAHLVMEGVDPRRVSLHIAPDAAGRVVEIPIDLVAQAVRQLIRNALDASSEAVELRVLPSGEGVALRVVDSGEGMTPEVLARATEPFFTTKPPGEGMGLGLHFVRSIAEHVGGALHLDSAPGEGTAATLELPGREG